MIIDVFTHILPAAFMARLIEVAPDMSDLGKRIQNVPHLTDLGQRVEAVKARGDYRQVISLPGPPIEVAAPPDKAAELARLANDGMADMVERHADQFSGFAAALPMGDVAASLEELHRAIKTLNARGVQIYTNVKGRPLDAPEFAPVFAAMADYDLPIWLHPARGANTPDYRSEDHSKYEIWWCFGWPYETSAAMARMVFSGLFDRHPDLKIITHHGGGMIPFFSGRVGPGWEVLGSRTSGTDYSGVLKSLKRPHLDYFKGFYADTAHFGGVEGPRCSLDFFGPDHLIFATDAPLAPIPESLAAVERLDLTAAERDKVMFGNAERLLKLSPR